jgi:hypothetical protein
MANRYTRRANGTTGSIPENNELCIQIGTATQAIDQIVWSAPHPVELVGVSATFSTTSTSGTLQVEKCPVGTAAGSGTDMLSSTMSLSGTAGVTVDGTVTTTRADRQLATGDRIALDFGGTVTGLVNCNICIRLKKIQAVGSDR